MDSAYRQKPILRNKRADADLNQESLQGHDGHALERETQKGHYHYWLQLDDIADIARLEYRYGTNNADTLFDIVGSSQQLSAPLKKFQAKVSQDSETRPLTLIVNLGNIHWVTLVIAYQSGQFYGYYVDSFGQKIPNDICEALEQAKVIPKDFHNFLHTPQQQNGHNCGLWALENAADLNKMLQDNQPLDWVVTQLKLQRDEVHFTERRQYLADRLRAGEARQARQPMREPSLQASPDIGINETNVLYFEQLIKTRLSDKSRSDTININVNVAGVRGKGHSIQNSNFEATGIKMIVPLTPAKCLPQQWGVPQQNLNFVGRDKLLKQVADHFEQEDQPVVLTACHGLGGIGKTQVALQFLWKHYEKYKGAVWYNAESRDRLLEEYIKLGLDLHLIHHDESNSPIEDRARRIKLWLEDPARAGWLLVYDNAPNYEVIRELLPVKKGKLLVTSRYTAGWEQGNISVDVFTIVEYRMYIQKVLGIGDPLSESDRAQIDQLAETLGRLPLALAQASAYIKKNKISISRYLDLYDRKKQHLLDSKILPFDYRASVYITWDITMEEITRESLLAKNWLNSCAYLASNDIPDFLLEAFAKDQYNNPTSEIYEEARGILDSYSMLTFNKQRQNASIHRLVQEVIQLKLKEIGEVEKNLMAAFKTLEKSFPYGCNMLSDYEKKRQLLPHLEAFMPHIYAWQQLVSEISPNLGKEIRDFMLELLYIIMANGYTDLGDDEKARDLLEHALPLLERHYGTNHPYVAATLSNLGVAYKVLGNAQKGCDLLERALLIIEQHHGPDHPEVAKILMNLGNAYGALGDSQKQCGLLERTLSIFEKHHGPDHPQVSQTLMNLGAVYKVLGYAEKSRDFLERALPNLEMHYGPNHPEVARTLENLGLAYRALGNAEKARDLLEKALSLLERHYGPNHPEVASTLTNLGCAYEALGQADKASDLFERALLLSESHFGPNHPKVARTLTNLGGSYRLLGDAHKGRDLLERALTIAEEYYGPNHHEVASTLTNLGAVYNALGDAKKACGLIERALTIKEGHNPDHLDVSTTLTNLGIAYKALDEAAKARDLFERALPILKKYYNPDHLEIARTLGNLGGAYLALGDAAKARGLFERALPIFEKHYGPNHLEVVNTLINLGMVYVTLHLPKKTCIVLERALPLLESHNGPDHPDMATILTNLGEAYVTLGQVNEACMVLQRALPILKKHYSPNHPKIAQTLTNLGTTYGILEDHKKACKVFERALPINESHYGPDHPEVALALMNLGAAYVALGQAEKAHRLLERALPIFEKHYGSNHLDVARTLTNLGAAYGILGDDKKACGVLERAFSIKERHYGPYHPEVARASMILNRAYEILMEHTLWNLGAANEALGQPENTREIVRALEHTQEAEPLFPWKTLEDETSNKNYKYSLQESDIFDIARIEYGNTILEIITSPKQLSNRLKNFEKKTQKENEQLSLTLVINQGQCHWVTLFVIDKNELLYAYYCDSLGGALPGDIRNALIALMPAEHIQDFKVKQHDAGYNSGIIALENAHTINQLTQAVFLSLSSSDIRVDKGLPHTVQQQLFDQIRAELSQYQPTLEAMKMKRDDFANKLFNDGKRKNLKALLNAIERNNLEGVKHSLNKGADIDAELNGYTPLHLAVKTDNLSMVQNLLAQGAISNAVVYQNGNKTPLDLARQYNHQSIIKLLSLVDLLFRGIEVGLDQDTVDDILSNLQDHDERIAVTRTFDRGGGVLLHYAAQQGCLKVVEFLLEQKVNVNIVTKNEAKWTPLHYAAKLNYSLIAKTLLKHKAFYDPQDSQGRTPIQLSNNSDITNLLSVIDKLFNYAKEGNLNELTSNLNEEVKINVYNRDGKTLLHLAAQNGHLEVIRTLLESNADINVIDNDNQTPLQLAVQGNHLAIAVILLEQDAKIDVLDEHQQMLVAEYMSVIEKCRF